MHIAFIGQKGFPASWGGVEVHVEQTARRLAARGHTVSIFNRRWYAPRGEAEASPRIRVVTTPTLHARKLDAISHAFTSTLASLTASIDVVHYHCMGPCLAAPLGRIARRPVVATIHGLDYHAAKWGRVARFALRCGEWSALHVADRTLVVARHMCEHYRSRGFETRCIPNGVVPISPCSAREIVDRWGLKPKGYLLFLARLEPNKGIEVLLDSYRELLAADTSLELRLVVAGNTDSAGYLSSLKRAAHPNVVFTGNVEGQLKNELISNAYVFVTPSSLEGLPIALLEAMSAGTPIVASRIPAHSELLVDGVSAILCDCRQSSSTTAGIKSLMGLSEERRRTMGLAAANASRPYTWERTVDQLEQVYLELV